MSIETRKDTSKTRKYLHIKELTASQLDNDGHGLLVREFQEQVLFVQMRLPEISQSQGYNRIVAIT